MIRTFIISYRDPLTGGERTAYVDATDWAEAERQVDLISSGDVTGELVEAGVAVLQHLQIGRA